MPDNEEQPGVYDFIPVSESYAPNALLRWSALALLALSLGLPVAYGAEWFGVMNGYFFLFPPFTLLYLAVPVSFLIGRRNAGVAAALGLLSCAGWAIILAFSGLVINAFLSDRHVVASGTLCALAASVLTTVGWLSVLRSVRTGSNIRGFLWTAIIAIALAGAVLGTSMELRRRNTVKIKVKAKREYDAVALRSAQLESKRKILAKWKPTIVYDAGGGLVLYLKTVEFGRGKDFAVISGTVVNLRDSTLRYTQITFNVFDKSGAQVGTALDFINGLEPGHIWKFRAIAVGKDLARHKFSKLSGF